MGTGQIGLEVIKRARAFGMNVIAWSRSLTLQRAAELEIGFAACVPDLAPLCDIISVHIALKAETRGLIDRRSIELMKPGTIFINTSRSEVVDEVELFDAVNAGKLRVGTDVFVGEPEDKEAEFKSAFASHANVYGTHHIGASTEQAQNAVAEETVTILAEYKTQGTVRNWVNRAKKTSAKWQLVVRHFDKPGVLAHVLGDLKDSRINVEEMENVVFDGGQTACATIKLVDRPSEDVVARMRQRGDEVIQMTVNEL